MNSFSTPNRTFPVSMVLAGIGGLGFALLLIRGANPTPAPDESRPPGARLPKASDFAQSAHFSRPEALPKASNSSCHPSTVLPPEIVGADQGCRMTLASDARWGKQTDEVRMASIRQIREWVQAAPEAAISWVDRLQDDQAWEALSTAVCLQVSQRDPKAALDLLARYRVDGRSGGLASVLLSTWAEKAPGEALAWVQTEAEPTARDRLNSAILQAEAFRSPEQAVSSLAMITSTSIRKQAVRGIFETWANRDLATASSYAEALSSPDLREIAREQLQVVINQRDAHDEDCGMK